MIVVEPSSSQRSTQTLIWSPPGAWQADTTQGSRNKGGAGYYYYGVLRNSSYHFCASAACCLSPMPLRPIAIHSFVNYDPNNACSEWLQQRRPCMSVVRTHVD